MVHVAKIIEIIGSSDKGWEDAAQVAIDEAKKTIHGITRSKYKQNYQKNNTWHN
jgi:flavin-binding protein dodecin